MKVGVTYCRFNYIFMFDLQFVFQLVAFMIIVECRCLNKFLSLQVGSVFQGFLALMNLYPCLMEVNTYLFLYP